MFPNDWYWKVGGSITQVYSSARGIFVSVNDGAYLAWIGLNNTPTAIDTAANLGEVLSGHLLRPTDTDVLDGYQMAQAVHILARPPFKILFNHENRMRAIERNLGLNGSPANVTPAQALTFVKGGM